MNKLRTLKLGLAAVVTLFAAAATYSSYAIFERQAALSELGRYNLTWAAGQALAELSLFEARVSQYGMGTLGVDRDAVKTRLEILYNRVAVLRGPALRQLAAPEQRAVVDRLAARLDDLDPLVAGLDRPGAVAAVLAITAALHRDVAGYASAANQWDGEQTANDQAELIRLHLVFSGLAATLVLCGTAMIGLLLVQNRLLERAHNRMAAMAGDLQFAKEAAEAANAAKSRFIANMSHELRTPLNAIIGFAEMIATEVLGPIAHRRYREYADDVLSGGRHMLEVVNDVLDLAKLQSGRYEVALGRVELRRCVARTVAMFRGATLGAGRDVALDERGAWPTLRADERALRQMLLNLLSNAVKFSEKEAPVRVRCAWEPGGEVRLTVVDRGIGMTNEEAAEAVRPFHQIDSRVARRNEGTGLGLSIANGMIEQHGGRLEIDSTPGVGSSISLVFPPTAVAVDALVEAA